MKILIGEQLAQLDAYTIQHEPIRPLDLMERAAQALVEATAARWPSTVPVYVFAGPGNNGGDGLAMARLLAQRDYTVRVWLFNVGDKLSLDCRQQFDRLVASGLAPVAEVRQAFEFPAIPSDALIIDALFGRGLNKPLRGGFVSVVQSINQTGADIVSIDMPSGLATEDNTYTPRHEAIHATLTLTIQLPKLAFLLPENAACVGQWQTVDIGLDPKWIADAVSALSLTEPREVRRLLRPRPAFAHKGTFGTAQLVAGSRGMAGAAILASRACMRSGVGKLYVRTDEASRPILQATVPEAIIASAQHPTCIGIGPGLGRDDRAAELLRETIAYADAPMVVDADAINLLAQHKDWLALLPPESILTPHPTEFDRLAGSSASDYERLRRAIELAKTTGLLVILKGHYTAVVTPDARVRFNPTGNAGMATAGSGDVLTGLLAGLLAQGYSPASAALLGTYLHGLAGDLAARHVTETCLVASDIIHFLPEGFKRIMNVEF